MREIKFRAWDKENDRMLFPDDTDDILFEITIDGIKTIDLNGNEDPYAGLPYLDTVVMQYTGLKDKKGVEIYVGDIVKHFNKKYEVVRHFNGKYVGKRNEFAELDIVIAYTSPECEVIGNIYENPDILGGLK